MSNNYLQGLHSFFKGVIYEGMNDLINQEMTENIVFDLLNGENPDTLKIKYSCELSLIHKIMGSSVFSERIKEFLERDIQISGLVAIKNIKSIASDDKISKATQLKANQWLAEKALEFNRLGIDADSPGTMTQDQLARRLKALQQEAIKRAIPINTGVIESVPSPSLDNMLD
jgi:hypothetical protein